MEHKIKNIAASTRARLQERSKQSGRDFQLVLTHYVLERLLYRLSISPHRDRFVLKGAMLFTIWLEDPLRPTRDLDLLGHGDADASAMASIFREIFLQAVADDGLVFGVDNIEATVIREEARYGGIRIETTATLERARVPVRIDIGFGDAVTPHPVKIDYPTLLDSPVPHLHAYPRETVVAEKLEAIVSLGFPNSRVKDFYDLFMIGRHFEFEGQLLTAAVKATFARRKTDVPVTIPDGLSDEFIAITEAKARWQGFLARDRLATDVPGFEECVEGIRRFLLPILAAANGSGDTPGHWPVGGPWVP